MSDEIINSIMNELGLDEVYSLIQGIFGAAGAVASLHTFIGFVLGIAMVVLVYILFSYIYMFQGRKAGMDNDWFAYVPIARTVYRLDMVGEDRWKVMFIGGLANIIKGIVVFILSRFVISGSTAGAVIFDIVLLAYLAACAYFGYIFNRKLYGLFNFNEHLALVNLSMDVASAFVTIGILGGFGPLIIFGLLFGVIKALSTVYTNVFNFMTAFDNRCQVAGRTFTDSGSGFDNAAGYGGYNGGSSFDVRTNSGRIMCTSGMYKDAVFQIESDFEIIIGRDSYFSSIVINENSSTISRKHCGIRYDKSTGNYLVTDYSSNGTYIADTKERLQRNVPVSLSSGTSIYLGDMNNRFKLM